MNRITLWATLIAAGFALSMPAPSALAQTTPGAAALKDTSKDTKAADKKARSDAAKSDAAKAASTDKKQAVSPGRAAMHERQKKCGAEWKEMRAAGKVDKSMTWPKYWSACNARLKASAG